MTHTPDFDPLLLENQICFPLYAAARKVTSLYTPFLRPLGITYTQYVVFMALWERDGVSVGELCQRLYLDTGTLTPVLKRMEGEGWLVRQRSDEDERVVVVTLTEKGLDVRDDVKDVPGKLGSCVGISADDAVELHRLLYEVLDATDAQADVTHARTRRPRALRR